MKTLVILSSILGDHSTSRKLVDHLVNRVAGTDADLSVQTRDLGAQPLPYFDGQVLGALSTPADQRDDAQRGIADLADTLVKELFDAERIIFAVPIYNFGLPAQLKSYIDFIARAGVTFRYSAEGVPEGLVKGKKVVVVTSRGGQARGTAIDTVTPYLQTMLGFVGMTDVTFVGAEGLAMGPDMAAAGVAQGKAEIDALALA